jgi:hypothetical protein
MMNKCTGYWLDNFVRTTHVQDNLTFISMDNNLTATIIMYYMDGSDQWHTMYKTKLVIPSTEIDILAPTIQIAFVWICCVKPNSVVYY